MKKKTLHEYGLELVLLARDESNPEIRQLYLDNANKYFDVFANSQGRPKGDIFMGDKVEGDKIENSGQAANVAKNIDAKNSNFNLQYNQLGNDLDYEALESQFAVLREGLLQKAKTPEEWAAIGMLASAEMAAKDKDESKVMSSLKMLGKGAAWVLDGAKDIAVDLAAEVIKKSMYP